MKITRRTAVKVIAGTAGVLASGYGSGSVPGLVRTPWTIPAQPTSGWFARTETGRLVPLRTLLPFSPGSFKLLRLDAQHRLEGGLDKDVDFEPFMEELTIVEILYRDPGGLDIVVPTYLRNCPLHARPGVAVTILKEPVCSQ